jgi:hypothetical protein
MAFILDLAKARGFDCVWAGRLGANHRAQAFYRKVGFVECGEHSFVLGKGVQRDVLMARPLVTRLFWYTFLTFFGTFQLLPTAPLRLAELGAAEGATGLFSGLFGAGASLGALATGRLSDRLGHARTLLIAARRLAAIA